jgi:hypothetical protein
MKYIKLARSDLCPPSECDLGLENSRRPPQHLNFSLWLFRVIKKRTSDRPPIPRI